MASFNQPNTDGSVPQDRARAMHDEMIKVSYAPFQCHFSDITNPHAELPYNTRLLAYMAGLVVQTTESRNIYLDLFREKFTSYVTDTHTDTAELLMTQKACLKYMEAKANNVEERGEASWIGTSRRIGRVRQCMNDIFEKNDISAVRNGKIMNITIPGLKANVFLSIVSMFELIQSSEFIIAS